MTRPIVTYSLSVLLLAAPGARPIRTVDQQAARRPEGQVRAGGDEPLDAAALRQAKTDAREPGSAPTLAEARDLLVTGAYAPAMAAYRQLAGEAGKKLAATIGLAECQLQTGDYAQAISSLTQIDGGDSVRWHDVLAELYRRVGRYEKTIEHARAAIKLSEENATAKLLLAETLERLGRRDEALTAYRWFDEQLVARRELPHDAEWITATAQGFLRYSVLTQTNVARRTQHALNEMLQQAYTRVDRTYWPARIAAADLLREKYNNDEVDGSVSDYEAALRINENLPQAYVGLGEVALEGWRFEKVEELAARAMQINPNYAPALHLVAKKLLLERRYEQAAVTAQNALKVNPNDLTALALCAAAHACRYDEEEVKALSDRVAEINPRCALLHRTLGDALSGIRQYAASEREYLEAIALEETEANAHTELGMMYMQWGEEKKARDVLDRAWALDPFNERTKFTLELLEMLEGFDHIETEHFVIKYDARKDPGMGEFIADYMEGIYGQVTGDYNTALGESTIVELFPTRRAFGVRITGKPWIHTIGASTGRVIALASPNDVAAGGPYDLSRVLRHEFTHTVTLAATRNRIPHWLTEGLAVYQEDAPRSYMWCQLLADAIRRDRLFTLESIDWGFIRPKRPTDRQMAYAQSEWMCEYIVQRFGYETINAMIGRLREGTTLAEVLERQLQLSPDEFDASFRQWAEKQAADWCFDLTPPDDADALQKRVEESPDDPDVRARLAKAWFDAGDFKRALSSARKALELDDGHNTALEVLGRVLASYAESEADEVTRRRYEEEAIGALEQVLEVDPDGWIAPKHLAAIALRRDELDRAVEMLKRLQRACPVDPDSWRGLAGVYLQRGEEDLALPQLLELARIEGNDPQVRAKIAGIFKRRGRLHEALFWLRTAVYIDPFSEQLHRALGDTSMQANDTAGALRAYTMLTRLAPDNARYFESAAFAAHKLGKEADARRFAAQAVKLDPKSSARVLIP